MNVNASVSALFLICLAVGVSGQCEGNSATTPQVVCESCRGGPYCDGENFIITGTCADDEVCDAVVLTCIPAIQSEIGNCGCLNVVDGTTFDGTYADPYDPFSYIDCSSGTPVTVNCPDGQTYAEDQCTDLPSCEGKPNGNYPFGSSCESYLKCESTITNPNTDPEAMTCATGTYFDILASDPDNPCISDPTCDTVGEFALETKCNMYYSCYNTVDPPIYHCCPEGQNYDVDSSRCVDGVGSCTRSFINVCKEEEYENTYCNYCANHEEGDQYATYLGKAHDDGTCTRRYYMCVEEEDGSMAANLTLCAEDEVFAPQFNRCENAIVHSCS